jgi:preprotein translocase subunit YajC
MGNIELAAAAKSSSGSYTFLLVIVVLFGLFYFVMIRPQRNKQRQVQQMQRQVMPGQQVRTTAGMYATVISADDNDVVLEIAPGVQARFLRRAVMEVVPDDDGPVVSDPTASDSTGTDTGTADSAAEDGYTTELSPGQ